MSVKKFYYPLDVESPPVFTLAGTTARVEDGLAKLGLARTPIDYFDEYSPEEIKEKMGDPDKVLEEILAKKDNRFLELANLIFRDEQNKRPQFTDKDLPDLDSAVVREAMFDFFYKDVKITLPYLELQRTLILPQEKVNL